MQSRRGRPGRCGVKWLLALLSFVTACAPAGAPTSQTQLLSTATLVPLTEPASAQGIPPRHPDPGAGPANTDDCYGRAVTYAGTGCASDTGVQGVRSRNGYH